MGQENSLAQKTMSGFGFTGTPVEKLGSSEYTICTVAMDLSGSVQGWERKLEECVKTIALACRKSPRAENLLLRVIAFNDNSWEVHGFCELRNINQDDYDNKFAASGYTALLDAYLNSVESTGDYAEKLAKKDIFCNAVVFVVTDGGENASTIATIGAPGVGSATEHGMKAIAKAVDKIRKKEVLESIKTVLIGVADQGSTLEPVLRELKDKSQTDEFVMIGDMSKGTLAKLAGFVSQSISSSSQALNTGGPSQPINPVSVQPINLSTI